ncbi:MAG: Fe(2+) transporter permease subunit FeoB [Legionella sp.]
MKHIVMIGNPNCGKTTLFNALTGSHQRVGNWAGVTVDKKIGEFCLGNLKMQLVDLPGIYSLTCTKDHTARDEQISTLEIVEGHFDLIINVIDACHLERHLYLTSQLLELQKPLIIALNMTDIAKQRGIEIDGNALSQLLNCPVVEIQANRQLGLDKLLPWLTHDVAIPALIDYSFTAEISGLLDTLKNQLISKGLHETEARFFALRHLEGDDLLCQSDDSVVASFVANDLADVDVLLADARYSAVHQIVTKVQKKCSDVSDSLTAKIDRIVLHRWLALPLFFTVMYLMFLFAINVGGAFQDFFNITTETVFVKATRDILQQISAPSWVLIICADGIGKGINTTLTFIPVISAMYFFLSLLESSGYMARAAFVMDKIMRMLGLPGKSFVPMIVGFGCNVPAIMAARTLDSERDRLLTIIMSPFMSCSARLAIYAVFVAAFFPIGGQNIVFSLYIIGILMAVLTGILLRKTLLRGDCTPLILELPAYHRPSLKRLIKETAIRLRYFIVRAGKLIIPACIILGSINALTIQSDMSHGTVAVNTWLSYIGRMITPLFSPMGLEQDNWPAAVGLLTGLLAKEVVVGTLNTLYSQLNGIITTVPAEFDYWGALATALQSIPQNFIHLYQVIFHPLVDRLSSDTPYTILSRHFDGQVGAYAYLLFVLLYIPCVSTVAAIKQEAHVRVMWFSIAWSLIVAYSTAVLFYQLARFAVHPLQSLVISFYVSMLILSAIMILILLAKYDWFGRHHALKNS